MANLLKKNKLEYGVFSLIFGIMCRRCFAKKSFLGRILCRQGAKVWSIAHAGIFGYICCNLINVHNKLSFFANLCGEETNTFWLCQNETREISNVKKINWKELCWSLCGCMLDLSKCLKTLCIRAMCTHACGYLMRFHLMTYHIHEKNNWYRLW